MQGIYTYIPETNHVPREYSVYYYYIIIKYHYRLHVPAHGRTKYKRKYVQKHPTTRVYN
jgi:hypothetical protein